MTYEILAQQTLTGISSQNPGLGNTATAARQLVSSQGLTAGVNFDGIMLVYFQPSGGDLASVPGHAYINDDFVWMAYDDINYKAMRQELGHNFGHEHHLSNSYFYRLTKPDLPTSFSVLDGFDMMSGGNDYDVSDFGVASKWFFNWVPDMNVVHLQPEGSTVECPQCEKEGTYKISAFDRVNKPPLANSGIIMGVHIPIATTVDNRVYSYWFSYRSGVDGLAESGLSVHLAWFEFGGLFGASYDSMNYDAFGDTGDSTFDSFVLEGTCYIVDPASYLVDRDAVSADAVRPKVCVDSINTGSDVTITVEFLNGDRPPNKVQVYDLTQNGPVECSADFGTSKAFNSFATKFHNIIEVTNTGNDGGLTWQMCPENGGSDTKVSAYFFDE